MAPARTAVFFHAHPDDESIATGGTMARLAADGHRVVLVVATRGENGEVDEGFLRPGEPLWERRVEETHASAEILGVSRVEFLGYVDSGMIGTPENEVAQSFWQADVEQAAERLAAICTEERADIVTAYDENGVYGHPDHIQVHRVGMRAAELAATSKAYMSTASREHFRRGMEKAAAAGMEFPADADPGDLDIGVSEDRITLTLDVRDHIDVKRRSMAAHASQISETSFFLAMPSDVFREAFGWEWFILTGAPPGTVEADLLDGLR